MRKSHEQLPPRSGGYRNCLLSNVGESSRRTRAVRAENVYGTRRFWRIAFAAALRKSSLRHDGYQWPADGIDDRQRLPDYSARPGERAKARASSARDKEVYRGRNWRGRALRN